MARLFAVSILYPLLLVRALGAQAVGTIDPSPMARQARLPQGAAPQGLTAVPSSPRSVSLTWMPAAGATGYLVYRGASADASVTPIATVSPPATPSPTAAVTRQPALRVAVATSTIAPSVSYLDAGVMPHATVYYRVAATYDGQKTGTSDAVSATTPAAPQPTGFIAIAGPGSVTLSWRPAPGATGYMLTRDNSVFLNNQQEIRDTTYTDDGLQIQAYTYRLVAYYTVPGLGEVEGDLTQVPIAVATPRTVAPKDFRLRGYLAGTIVDFLWTPLPGVTGYTVLRALASNGNFAVVPGMEYAINGDKAGSGPSGGPAEWARDYNTVQIGETYLYKLLAYYAAMPPGESQVLRVEVKPKPPGVANLTASSPQPGTVVLHWTPPAGANGFCIRRSKGIEPAAYITKCGWPSNPGLPGTTSSYTDTALWNGATYQYDVDTYYSPELWGEIAGTSVKVGP